MEIKTIFRPHNDDTGLNETMHISLQQNAWQIEQQSLAITRAILTAKSKATILNPNA